MEDQEDEMEVERQLADFPETADENDRPVESGLFLSFLYFE